VTTIDTAVPVTHRHAPRQPAFTIPNRKEALIMGRRRHRRHSHRHGVGHALLRIVEHILRHAARGMR